MKQFSFLVLLFLSIQCIGNPPASSSIPRKVERIVARIERINVLMGSTASRGTARPEQYQHFLELCQKASPMELFVLTAHRNSVVRCYAFWALTYHPAVDLSFLAQQHAHDTAVVNTFFDAAEGTETVSDFFQHINRDRVLPAQP